GEHVAHDYAGWLNGSVQGPPLSVDVVKRALVPNLQPGRPLLFVIIDCMRLDQYRTIRPLIGRSFDIEESLYSSILPTATPYARNAIFSGQFPDEIAAARPDWWTIDEGSLNAFEDDLLREQ